MLQVFANKWGLLNHSFPSQGSRSSAFQLQQATPQIDGLYAEFHWVVQFLSFFCDWLVLLYLTPQAICFVTILHGVTPKIGIYLMNVRAGFCFYETSEPKSDLRCSASSKSPYSSLLLSLVCMNTLVGSMDAHFSNRLGGAFWKNAHQGSTCKFP